MSNFPKAFTIVNMHGIMWLTYNFKHRECLQLHCFCFFGVPPGRDIGSVFLKKRNEGRKAYKCYNKTPKALI